MKKILVIFCSLVLLFVFAACGAEDDASTDAASSDEVTTTDSSSSQETASEGDLGDYHVAIKDYSLGKDYEGNDVIIITYDYTNNSEDSTAFDVATVCYAYQDGIELEHAYVMDDSTEYDDGSSMKNIKTGVTIEVQNAYLLSNTDSPVDVEVIEFISFSDEKIEKTFAIAE